MSFSTEQVVGKNVPRRFEWKVAQNSQGSFHQFKNCPNVGDLGHKIAPTIIKSCPNGDKSPNLVFLTILIQLPKLIKLINRRF